MAEFIHLLYVDDKPLDRELVREALAGMPGGFQLTEAKSRQEFERLLAQDRYDLVLSEFDIPGFNGLQLLDLVQAKKPELPVVIVTGTGSEEIAVAAMQRGAADYVIKSSQHLQRLPATIQRILQQKRIEKALRRSAARQTAILDALVSSIALIDNQGYIRVVNEAWRQFARENMLQTSNYGLGCNYLEVCEAAQGEDAPIAAQTLAGIRAVLAGDQPEFDLEYPCHSPDKRRWFTMTVTLLPDDAGGAVIRHLEITERKLAQIGLSRYAAQLRGLAQASAVINTSLSVSEILATVIEQARTIIGAHQAVASLTEDEHWSQAIHHVSFSDKYAAWRDYEGSPDASGIYALICQTNQPMRLTQAELEAHPAWQDLSQAAGKHPPLRGWLAVPLIEREGHNMGLIQLSDKYEGDFTVDDETILVQLAQVAEVAIENACLLAAERTAHEQLRNLTRYLHAVREDERTEIAREVHDELGQALTALKLDLAWLTKRLPDDPAVRQRAGAASQLISSTIQTVQYIAAELRPGLLDDLGLVPALEWQAQQFSERTGIACHSTMAEPEASLGRERDTVIFRIFQETLANVTRHAEATRVEVELKERPEGLTLTVRDNGRGISKAQLTAPSSLGLMGMRERARAWGGKVTFTGRVGLGTTVTVFLPRPAKEAARD